MSPGKRWHAVLAFLAAMTAQAALATPEAVLGEWRGTSLCTNRQIAPACNDEQTHYIFSRVGTSPQAMHVDARKLVGDAYLSMGEFDLEYSAAADEWFFLLETRVKARWSFRAVGDELTGTLVDRATGAQVRKVAAQRWKGKPLAAQ